MGNYTDQAAIVKAIGTERVIQLTDFAHTGAIDADVVTEAIADAEGLVDSYVRKVFETPLSPVPPIIAAIARKLAIYTLHTNRDVVSEAKRLEQEDRLTWLKYLAEGKVDLGISPAAAPSGRNRSTSTPNLKDISKKNFDGWT